MQHKSFVAIKLQALSMDDQDSNEVSVDSSDEDSNEVSVDSSDEDSNDDSDELPLPEKGNSDDSDDSDDSADYDSEKAGVVNRKVDDAGDPQPQVQSIGRPKRKEGVRKFYSNTIIVEDSPAPLGRFQGIPKETWRDEIEKKTKKNAEILK